MTGYGGAVYAGNIKPETSVVVIGCGAVGLSAIQGARISGASKIIAVDIFDNKLDFARRVGATHTVNSKNIRLFSSVHELDGFLVGGASQSPKEFIDIIKNYYK